MNLEVRAAMSSVIRTGGALAVLRAMPDASVQCCVTSPPYFGPRDYGTEGQIGLERTPAEYVVRLVEVFREVRRVLRDDGTCWLNLGDSYVSSGGHTKQGGSSQRKVRSNVDAQNHDTGRHGFGLPIKNLIGAPWRAAFGLQDDGWILRSEIIWEKPNVMPESVTDRPTRAHESLFLFTKKDRYFYDLDSVREPHRAGAKDGHPLGRNARSVWSINTQPYKGAHFAVFPEELPRRCILAGSRPGDTVLDPFAGSGTTGAVCKQLGRSFIGIELNADYKALAEKRIAETTQMHPPVEEAGPERA